VKNLDLKRPGVSRPSPRCRDGDGLGPKRRRQRAAGRRHAAVPSAWSPWFP